MYLGFQGSVYLINVVIEMYFVENVMLCYVKVMQEGDEVFYMVLKLVCFECLVNLYLIVVNYGGVIVCNDLCLFFDGEGIDCVFNGFVFGKEC